MSIGVGLALFATVCFAIGNALEKRGVDRLPALSLVHLVEFATRLLTSPWWLAGAVVSVAGLFAQIEAFTRISLSLAQSIGVAGIVLLVVISRLHFREAFHRRELGGIALSVASLVLVSLSLTRVADAAGTRSARDATLVATVSVVAAAAALLGVRKLRVDDRGFVYGCAAGLLYGLSGLGAKGVATLVVRHDLHLLAATPYVYVFVGAWATGLVVFQNGLQRGRVGVIGPVSSMVGSAFVVAVGTPVFGEHLPASVLLLGLRLAGFAGILIGSTLVAWGLPAAIPPDPPPTVAVDA